MAEESLEVIEDYVSEKVKTMVPYGIRFLDPHEADVVTKANQRIKQKIGSLPDLERKVISKIEKLVPAINPNLDRFSPEVRKSVANYAQILIRQGYIKASIGDTVVPGHPVFRTNRLFLRFLKEAFREGQTGYSGSTGIPELKSEVARFTKYKFGFDANKADVLVGKGATDPIQKIAQAIMENSYGIAGAPLYPPYESSTHLSGGKLEIIVTRKEDGYKLRPEDIEERISALRKNGVPASKIKALWLTHPNNPTGSFYTSQELGEIAKVASRHNLTVVADEVYGGTVSGEGKYTSMLKVWESLPEKKRFPLVHLYGFSKEPLFWFTGSRIGWALIPGKDGRSEKLKSAIERNLAPPELNPTTLIEAAGAKLLHHYLDHPAELERYTKRAIDVVGQKNRLLSRVLNKIPQVKRAGGYAVPSAAFYHFVPIDVSRTGLADENHPDLELAKHLQKQYRMRITHGNAFYYPSLVTQGDLKIVHQRVVSLLPNSLIEELGRRTALALNRLEARAKK